MKREWTKVLARKNRMILPMTIIQGAATFRPTVAASSCGV
jgi:hypothetical protein